MTTNGKTYNLDDFIQLQKDIGEWRLRNFGPASIDDIGDRMLGVVEELGELAHLILKRRQNIRGGYELNPNEFLTSAKDAVGDLIIFLMGVADLLDISLAESILLAWAEVQHRDWVKFPKDGVSE